VRSFSPRIARVSVGAGLACCWAWGKRGRESRWVPGLGHGSEGCKRGGGARHKARPGSRRKERERNEGGLW
jgi:hypothetical protein